MIRLLSGIYILFCLLLGFSATPAFAEESKPAKQSGSIVIKSNVKADVYIDHKLVGQTPFKKQIKLGAHNVRVAADYHAPFARRVEVQANQPTVVNAQLKKGKGSVEFHSSASRARVSIDDQAAMIMPIRLDSLRPGKHRYRIFGKGYDSVEGEFVIGKGKNHYIHVDLASSRGLVEVRSIPKGAHIYIDSLEKTKSKTPMKMKNIDAGKHVVILKLKGLATVIRHIDTSSGEKGMVEATLPKHGSDLTIKTNDSKAKVRVEGVLFGRGKKVKLGTLEKGIYTLSVHSKNKKPINTQITIPEHGTLVYKANLVAKTNKKRVSTLKQQPNLLKKWYFWAGVGGATAATGASAVFIYNAVQPEPAPEGDVTILLP